MDKFIISNNNKSVELISYIDNFNNDINQMLKIRTQMKKWTHNGIDLSNCIISIDKQIDRLNKKMFSLLENIKNNILELKKVDDRVKDSSSNITINDISFNGDNLIEHWKKVFTIYNNLYTNLSDDVKILNNVIIDVSNYKSLGVDMGNTLDIIKKQIDDINIAAKKSSEGVNDIINLVKLESDKIEIESFIEKTIKLSEDTTGDITTTLGSSIKSFYMEEYAGFKKEVSFDHSIIKNNKSIFEIYLESRTYTLVYLGGTTMIGGGELSNRFYIGWEASGKILMGLGGITIKSINKYNNLINTKIIIRYIQYGDKTGRFVINDVQEDLLNIPDYSYTSTKTFYYNGHYDNHGTHYGTTYKYILF